VSIDIRHELSAKEKNVAFDTIALDFASMVTWNLDSLTDDVVQWLNDPSASQTSKVGILSSPTFLNIVNSCGFGDTKFGAVFQKVMYTETLIYTNGHEWDRPSFTIEDLKMIGALSGQKWLELLEKQLKPHILASRTKEQLQLLFLLVFGTILAVGYTGPLEFENPKYVCRRCMISINAADMVYLGRELTREAVFYNNARIPLQDLSSLHGLFRDQVETSNCRSHREAYYDCRTHTLGKRRVVLVGKQYR
jgi:hypothetical protein